MSMYNAMNGVNPATFIFLPMLGMHPDAYPRFRDCFIGATDTDDEGKIMVYTRTGGGNRDSYENEINEMREMKTFIRDYDDTFDSTYANFIFDIPEEWKTDFDLICDGKLAEVSKAYQDRMYEVYPKLTEKFDEVFKTD